MAGLPLISEDLIDYLEGICPDQSPALTTPEREIWFNAGRVALVKHIRSLFEEQNRNILEG